ncbi:hypothetical protein ACHAXN_005056 [Cyclotella atomus]
MGSLRHANNSSSIRIFIVGPLGVWQPNEHFSSTFIDHEDSRISCISRTSPVVVCLFTCCLCWLMLFPALVLSYHM